MINPVLELTLQIEGPVISQDAGAPLFGFDTIALSRDGSAVIPGSQIKGLLREVFAMAIIQEVPALNDEWLKCWFGEESAPLGQGAEDSDYDGYEPHTGRLIFADFKAALPHEEDKDRNTAITRIEIDGQLGSVKEGMLQIIQAPFDYGDIAGFTGSVRVLGDVDCEKLKSLRAQLDWAFQLVPAVGAMKTSGFGRLLKTDLGDWSPLSRQESKSNAGNVDLECICKAGGVELNLRPMEPFVVWPTSFGDNFFAGDETIPGQVLKAVAARWLSAQGLLTGREDAFSRLIFRHARPAPSSGPNEGSRANGTPRRPSRIPLSVYLAFDKEGNTKHAGDALDKQEDFDIYSRFWTIAFQPDWKSVPKNLEDHYGCPAQVGRVTRTRTAIGPGGVADDERLFTYAATDPDGFIWRSQVLIPSAASGTQLKEMAKLLAALNGTSLGLGKTKAPVHWTSTALKTKPTASCRNGVWRVVLQTPACLHGPAAKRSKCSDPIAALTEDYKNYWTDVLGEGVHLVDFMAQQSLAGGYLARRYPVAPKIGFEPYLLTDPGSVFVLCAREGDATQMKNESDELALAGLPLSKCWPKANWKTHPFLPEAGWGEVRISDENPVPTDDPA